MPLQRSYTEVDLRRKIAELGPELGPKVRDATQILFSGCYSDTLYYRIARDIPYGPNPRHRLDIHRPESVEAELCPVLCFVHGGGFINGDKHKDDLPYYDNVGQWAAANSILGVNITYRFAPEFAYPSGAQDVALALEWIQLHAHEFGGDRSRVVVMGHSAGSAHVASCVSSWSSGSELSCDLRGVILSSGIYDPSLGGDTYAVYYGNDLASLPERSSIPGLCKTKVPLLITSTEFDSDSIKLQTFALVEALMQEHHQLPRYVLADGHNHYSVMYQFGTSETCFSDRVLRFIELATGTDH
ncbi:MAG TPA: alpha/beta hydrolase [Acidimicrobiales bacterium]|nr:alpha/beta hydrolase [Acidimicrobiales bacterium]